MVLWFVYTGLLWYVASAQTLECTNDEVRLVSLLLLRPDAIGTGVLEYCTNNMWHRVCVEGDWRTDDARVACRQLGYDFQENNRDISVCLSSSEQINFVMFQNRCDGTELTISDCGGVSQITECHDCSHGWLECQPVCIDGQIRLVGGMSLREGRVEVCVDGHWGTVCNNQEGLAGAVCAQLGFSPEGAEENSNITEGHFPISTCAIQQDGSLSCIQQPDGSCDHGNDLRITCQAAVSAVPLVPPMENTNPPSTTTASLTEANTPVTTTTVDTTMPSSTTVGMTPSTLPLLCDYCASNCNQPTSRISGTTSTDTTTGPEECINMASANVMTIYTSLVVVIVVLLSVIVAMLFGWLCTCVLMRRKSADVKANNRCRDHKMEHNPLYNSTLLHNNLVNTHNDKLMTQQESSITSHTSSSNINLSVGTISLQSEQREEVYKVPIYTIHECGHTSHRNPTYNVINKTAQISDGYDVLVHSVGDQPTPLVGSLPQPQGQYSKLDIHNEG